MLLMTNDRLEKGIIMNEMIKVIASRTNFLSSLHSKYIISAILFVSFATILRVWPFQAISKEITWFTFYPAVIMATLYGGISTGLITTLLACLTMVFLWPVLAGYPIINNFYDVLDMLLFVILCGYISYLNWMVKRTRIKLKKVQTTSQSVEQNQQFLRELIDSVPNMIGYWDKELRCQFANNAFSKWFTHSPKDIIGVSFQELAGEKLYSLNKPYIQNVLMGEEQRFERTLKKSDGTISNILAHYIPDFDVDGTVKGFSIQSSEVTELKEAQAQLKLAACVFDCTLDGILITDADGIVLSVNPAFTYITGFQADQALGQTPRFLKSHRHNKEFYDSMWHSITTQGQWHGEIWNRRKDGDIFLARLTISMVCDGQDRPLRYISVFNDITDLWHKDEHLKHLAFYDPLTDLPNRTLLIERLGQKIINCERDRGELAVMFLDLDEFKVVNDTFGHNIGDDLLKVISKRLLGLVRQSDIVARLGGDEFIFVLNDSKAKDEILLAAQRIINSINKPVELSGITLEVGASVGISKYPDDGVTPLDLIKKADKAMYASKVAGKNSMNFFKITD